MGTQQVLIIVLTIIIVGVAIAVAIQVFYNQAYQTSKSTLAADSQSFATQAYQFYKTGKPQGGAGGNKANMTAADIGSYIGWGGTENIDAESGEYKVFYTANEDIVYVIGLGKVIHNHKIPAVTTNITLSTGVISTHVKDVVDTVSIADLNP